MDNLENLDLTDATFVSDLRESHNVVTETAAWIARLGYPTTIRPLRVRPTASRMNEFSDDGDLEVGMRVEVKNRPRLNFNNFRYPSLIIDVAHAWDRANPKPFLYITKDGHGNAGLVFGHLHPLWQRVEKFDNGKGRSREFLECPWPLVVVVPWGGNTLPI